MATNRKGSCWLLSHIHVLLLPFTLLEKMSRFLLISLLLSTVTSVSVAAIDYSAVTEVCHHITSRRVLNDPSCVAQYRTLERTEGGISVQNHLAHGDFIGWCSDLCEDICIGLSKKTHALLGCMIYPGGIVNQAKDQCCCDSQQIYGCGPNTECMNDVCTCLDGYAGNGYNLTSGCHPIIVSANFDSGSFVKFNSAGSEATISSTLSRSGTYSLQIKDGNNTSRAYMDPLDVSAYVEVKVNFWYRSTDMENGDAFALEASSEAFSGFSTVKYWAEGTDFTNGDDWKEGNGYINTTNVDYLALQFRSYANMINDTIYIDDVVVTGLAASS